MLSAVPDGLSTNFEKHSDYWIRILFDNCTSLKAFGKTTIDMKKIIMKVGLIVMALSTMITMSACSKINHETATDVCTALSEKYGETFTAIKIGDRFNTDSAKLYVHPADNENILFTARIDKDTGEVTDNYIEETVNYQVENVIKAAFSNEGITAASRCMVVTSVSLNAEKGNYSPKNFSEEYGFDHYTIYLVLKNGVYSSANILNAIKSASETVGVKLVIVGYIFDDEMYSKCVSDIQSYPNIGITMIEANSPLSSFNVNVDEGVCSISEADLSNKLGRS